ncbi:MAG: hypothetical protein NT116_02675, partial [Candidatus Parcubacteria bacterium]|nr:hypothetical protein [Candidatus Parcubacteria bacterium]
SEIKLEYSENEECVPEFDPKVKAIVIGRKSFQKEAANYLLRLNYKSDRKHLSSEINALSDNIISAILYLYFTIQKK